MAQQKPTSPNAMNTTFKKLSDASFKMGANLNKRRQGGAGQFSNVANAVQGAGQGNTGQSNVAAPKSVSSLGPITTPYGGSTAYEKYHPGIDIGMKMGTPIPSFTGGTVVSSVTGQKQDASKPSFGNSIVIKNSDGKYFRYSHLHDVFTPAVGTKITKGKVIGTAGNTGSTYSLHGGDATHLDLRIFDAAKKYYNPSTYLSNYIGT